MCVYCVLVCVFITGEVHVMCVYCVLCSNVCVLCMCAHNAHIHQYVLCAWMCVQVCMRVYSIPVLVHECVHGYV